MKTASLSVALVICASMAAAQDAPKPKSGGEWSFRPYLGQSETQDSSLTIDRPGENTHLRYQNIKWGEESYKGPLYYGYKFTYWPSPDATIGYGFDFVHYKVFADTGRSTRVSGTLNGVSHNAVEPIRNTLKRFSISHGVNFAGLNVLARKRYQISDAYPSGRLQPYGGVGAGITINHPESQFDTGSLFERYQFGGFAWQLFFGVEYKANPKWGVFAEFKYTDYTPKVEVANGGTGSARLRTQHLAFGTTYRFK